MSVDPVAIAQTLIRCPSVTPEDAGALDVLEAALIPLGFRCERLRFAQPGTAPIGNLYARLGDQAPNFCFAGHTDVVPPGDRAGWRFDPFAAEIHDDILYGRGAADMKSAIAAFVAAAARMGRPQRGSISLLITGDEEGPAINGTRAVLDCLAEKGEHIDHCLVGEPTSVARVGDTIKIGRRGSMNVAITVRGIQGHSAYPQLAINPIPVLAVLVARLACEPLDTGNANFEPSSLVFTTFDVGNPATNVSPSQARAACNIRFNNLHTPESLRHRIERAAAEIAHEMGGEVEIEASVSGLAFVTERSPFTTLIERAISDATGEQPAYSTSGGTSDARFIRAHCPVVEVGLPGGTMHKINESVPIGDIRLLADVYGAILARYFAEF